VQIISEHFGENHSTVRYTAVKLRALNFVRFFLEHLVYIK